MCTDIDERPPLPPVRGGADRNGEFTLTAADGTASNAYFAHPNVPTDQAVVILPDFRGLTEFYRELAVRFAEAGFHAVTIDYYTRTLGRGSRPSEQDALRAELGKMNKRDVDLDVEAAVQWLRALPGASIESIFTVGFCCGGTFAWQQATRADRLAGNVSFYGVPALLEESRIDDMRGPILMMLAGEDFTPVEVVEELADKVRARGEVVETEVYERATHGFFSRGGEFADECDAAWRRVLDFFERNGAKRVVRSS